MDFGKKVTESLQKSDTGRQMGNDLFVLKGKLY